MANEQDMSNWTDLLHSSTKLLEQAAPSPQFPPLQRNLDQLEALSKKIKAKTIRTEAPSQSIAATRLLAREGINTEQIARDLKSFELKTTFEDVFPAEATSVEEYLQQVHEMAMVSAIQEAQKDNVRSFNDYMIRVLEESGTKMPAISSSSGRNAGGHQEEKPPKAMTTKICIAIRSFEDLVPGNTISGLPADVRKIRLPESRVLYTVLRSPHVDKKSREQFEMRMKKQLLVAKVQSHELRNKYFWLKRQRIFGAQYEIQFHCKTRMDKDKLQKLLP